ncbi:serine carboxypeptidase S28-domain-containing protein [Mycena filopes]|nr:serine carboxypeptidase S28-domain-containing protein [Mycena filopes]
MLLQLSLFAALSLSQVANAQRSDGRPHANFMPKATIPIVPVENTGPVTSKNGTMLPPYNQTFFFQQLIDHNNPSLGTFTQRYWHTYEFYEDVLSNAAAFWEAYSGYLTNVTINGRIAQQENGAAVVIEHRFYGLSNPLPDLSVKSLKLHTIQQAIDDLEYFMNNVVLPMPNGGNLKPATTPWILVGGSYSGALTSYAMVNKPGLFAAGYASSAVVETILDFWQYFEPERLFMPANCSADVERVVAHIDQVFTGSDKKAIQAIKSSFGMGDVTHLDDVAGSLRNNLWDWQGLSLSIGPGAQFFNFCDALEVKNGVNAPAAGWGLDHALSAWSSYWSTTYLDLICGGDDAQDCLGSYNTSQSYWTDTSIDNAGRCNEVGFLQESAPPAQPSLVSRLIQPSYDLRQCQQMFPAAFPTTPNVQTARTNRAYAGWNVTISNLFFANGQRMRLCPAPGVTIKSTASQPIAEGEGYHCADLSSLQSNPKVNDNLYRPLTVSAADHIVNPLGLASIHGWIATWKPAKGKRSVEEFEARELSTGLAKPLQGWFRTPVFE